MANDSRKGLLEDGEDIVGVVELAMVTGLSQDVVRGLIESGRIGRGLFDEQGHAVAVFADALPTAEQLTNLGLTIRSEYRPDDLRTAGVDLSDDDDENGSDEAGASVIRLGDDVDEA